VQWKKAMFPDYIILVVKDKSDETEDIAQMLSDDYRVIGAERPEDALTHAADGVDLVISALESPQFNGLQLLRMWKARQPRTPFVVITGGRDVDAVVEAMKLGAADCIVKPVNAGKLKAVVSRLVASGAGNGAASESHVDSVSRMDHKANIDIPPGTSLEDLERAAVEQALAQHHGNRTHAAKTLGISVRTLQRKLKAWGLPVMGMQHASSTNSFLISPHSAAAAYSAHAQ
jgi:DNA-binding NtrC family response regulator